jgi:integrase/recombinase XerD
MVDPCWARVCGPLEPYADGLRGELERLGYTPLSAAGHVRLVAHLSRWMIREGLSISALTPTTVDAYFAERRARYHNSVTARSVRPLLDYLQELGVVAAPVPAAARSACEQLLGRYRDYLLVERGLVASTVELNVRMVRPFLAAKVRADGQLDLQELSVGEVATFVVAQSRKRPRSVGRLVTALRSLLRFVHVEGVTERPLAGPCRRWPVGHFLEFPKL